MNSKPYYTAYEDRYRAVYDAGIGLWGNSAEDKALRDTLAAWVTSNDLRGKRVIDFACGEGSCGLLLTSLGCQYLGVDISPSALDNARKRLADCKDAELRLLDIVKDTTGEVFDAAIDVMGFHMLVTDDDRRAYLDNVRSQLRPGAPMLFVRQAYRADAYEGEVGTIEDWKAITGEDYDTPQKRTDVSGKEVMIPLLPARAKTMDGYRRELEAAGFAVESIAESEENRAICYSVTIHARRK